MKDIQTLHKLANAIQILQLEQTEIYVLKEDNAFDCLA